MHGRPTERLRRGVLVQIAEAQPQHQRRRHEQRREARQDRKDAVHSPSNVIDKPQETITRPAKAWLNRCSRPKLIRLAPKHITVTIVSMATIVASPNSADTIATLMTLPRAAGYIN